MNALRLAPLVLLPLATVFVIASGPTNEKPYGLSGRAPVVPFLDKFPKAAPGAASGGWTAGDAFPNLTFEDPIGLTPEPGSNRLHVCGRQGMIHAIANDPGTTEKILVLDLADVTQGYDDCGLFGIAFHPEFGRAGSPNRGYFYVCYQYSPKPVIEGRRRPPGRTPGYNRVSRFTLPDGWFEGDRDPAVVRASEQVLINQFDEHVWHSMGNLCFGEDGFLYIGTGDEGGVLDNFNNSQKIDDGLFAGMLRIDVDQNPKKSHPIRRQPQNGGEIPEGWPQSFTANYFIPNDNPWVDPSGANLEEFWAIGLRNPFRMTFDPVDKRIWVGDVGQTSREEVNIIRKGGNYQWAYREGTLPSVKPRPAQPRGVEVPPVYDYGRENGEGCVIGGYVYRGRQFPELRGKYVFGDNTSNRVWAMDYDGINPPTLTLLTQLPWPTTYSGLSSFGLDHAGEIYLTKVGAVSKIYKLARQGEPLPEPPALLSQTGAFTNLKTLTPAPGLIPYEVNSPLWSDGALKRRWMAVPNDGAPYEATTERIDFAPRGEWKFPAGTVFVKHFELPTDHRKPAVRRRLETRFLVRDAAGGVYGVTYRWREDQKDAELLPDSFKEDIVIRTATGTRRQTWSYPSRADCMTCHNSNAGHVLGVNTRQLNGDCLYPETGVTDNQLRTLNRIGLFAPALAEDEIHKFESLVAVTDRAAPLEERVRSYLDANCAQCHRPGGVQAYFDARYDTPLARQGLLNGLLGNPLGIDGAKVIAPRKTALSILHARLASNSAIRMPTLARDVVDTAAVKTLEAWIASLPLNAGATPADRVAVLTNDDVHFTHRGRSVGPRMFFSERAQAVANEGALPAEQIAALREMLANEETFVIAHALLSAQIDALPEPERAGEFNGLLIDRDNRGTVLLDLKQRARIEEYWRRKLESVH